MRKLSLILAIAAVFVFAFVACDKDNDGQTGRVLLSITDAPIDTDGITGVFITFTEIQYHISGNNWASFPDFEGPRTFNLLDLTRGETDLLGDLELEAGKYTQLRFILDAPSYGQEPPSNPGCYLEFENGETQPLFVPSGAQTGYKAVGTFEVPANGTVEVTADFDVRRSVVKAGASGKYILKPTIRLVVNDQSGTIKGNVFNIPDNTQIVVYAYESGTYDEAETAEPAPEETRFPNAVSSDRVCENDMYHIAFLAPMDYDLIVVANVDDEFSEVLMVIEDVTVESQKITELDIVLPE